MQNIKTSKSKRSGARGAQAQGQRVIAVPAAKGAKRNDVISGEHTVQSREFVANLSGNSSGFLLLGVSGSFPGYDLNPGNQVVFPWLSLIAAAYEKYRFEDLSFELVPRNPTSAAGAVYMALDYDWDDTPATTLNELMSNRGAVNSDVWTPCKLRVDIPRLNEDVPWRYVADFPRTESSQRMVYGGFLMVGIAGTAATVSFDLFVQYRIRFSLPALHSLDSSVTHTFTVAKTVPALGTGWFDTLPVISGIATVLSGVAGTPILGGSPSGTPAYKIGTGSKGEFTLTLGAATAGQPPSNYPADTTFDAVLADASGNLLAYASAAGAASAAMFQQGPDSAATWSTNGALGRSLYSFSLNALRKAYPTLAFIVPYVYSVAGRVLSTSSKISARYTEL